MHYTLIIRYFHNALYIDTSIIWWCATHWYCGTLIMHETLILRHFDNALYMGIYPCAWNARSTHTCLGMHAYTRISAYVCLNMSFKSTHKQSAYITHFNILTLQGCGAWSKPSLLGPQGTLKRRTLRLAAVEVYFCRSHIRLSRCLEPVCVHACVHMYVCASVWVLKTTSWILHSAIKLTSIPVCVHACVSVRVCECPSFAMRNNERRGNTDTHIHAYNTHTCI